MDTRSVIIFCPCIEGHRQNYCCVLADWFINAGYQVVLALGRAADGKTANFTPLLGQLAVNPMVEFVDLGDTTGTYMKSGHWINTVSALECEHAPVWTVIPIGDECRLSLDGLGERERSEGTRRCAIFIRADHIYRRDMTDTPWRRRIRTYNERRHQRTSEYSYFSGPVFDRLGLDIILSTNPDFVNMQRDDRYRYMPEIYRAWGFETKEISPRVEELCTRYSAFLKNNIGKQVILYYGIWQARRRYGDLLKLVLLEEDTVFVGCGRSLDGDTYHAQFAGLRDELDAQGRIFEVDLPFLPENAFFDMLFDSCEFMLLPYQHWYGLSGSMIQALSFGKPVLVPDTGYMCSMVRKYHFGMVFKHLDFVDFRKRFSTFRMIYGQYQSNSLEFGDTFNITRLHHAFDSAFVDKHH